MKTHLILPVSLLMAAIAVSGARAAPVANGVSSDGDVHFQGDVPGRVRELASARDDVLKTLRETAASKNYYWAWTCPWLHDGKPNGDDSRLVVWDGQVPRPKPTDSVKLETAYQKFAGGRRALINYADLYAVAGTWHSDRYYSVNRAGLTAAIKRQWKEFGGLQVFSWHMDQPYCTNGFEQASYRFKSFGENRNVIRQILDGTGGPCGTDIGGSTVRRKPYPTPRDWFMASLKDVANFINGLVDDETGEKIPVVLRYPHECDGSWFWWGRGWCTAEEFRRFCRFEADYLRKACGPDQIIFAYTPDVSWKDFGKEGDGENTFLAYYPGDKYVDIIGIDDYSIGNGDDRKVESNLNETIRKLRLMTAFAKERRQIVCVSESGGWKKRDDFWQWLHRAATADGVDVAFVDTWAWYYGSLPDTSASEADEKAFAARPEVLMEGKTTGFRKPIASLSGAWAAPVEIRVSPDGDVRSLETALGRLRELRRSGALGRDIIATIRVASGRYSCTNTIELMPEDSNVRIVGAVNGGTVFDGAVALGSFSCGADGIWRAAIPKGLVFDQLWVNGKRAQRARTPNRHFLYMKEREDTSPSGAFYAFPNDLAGLARLSKEELSRVLVDYWMSWDMGYARILSIDSDSGLVRVDRQDRYGFFNWDKTHPRYALENYRAALDAPGEWFLDASASELLYIPRKGETLADAHAYAPVVKTIIRLKGDARNGARVRNVTFENIGLEYTSLPMEGKGIPSGQAAVNVFSAALEVEGVDGFSFVRGHVAHTGGHGICVRKGSVNARIDHSLIEDLGAGGVYLGSSSRDVNRPDLDCANLSLSNSIVRAGGRILNGAVGVWLGHVHDCWVVHNEICDFFYTGVSFGWWWGYGQTVTRRNHIDFNHIHHIQQGRLSDGGAVYSLGDQEGSTVCNNWIHDVNGYRDNGSPAWGLYTDEGSAGVFLSSNLVERCRSGAVHQHYGRENVFRNNIFALFDEAGVWRSRLEDHVTMRIENNVLWWTNIAARAYRAIGGSGFLSDLVVDGNVYWCPAVDVKKTDKVFNGGNWEGWREKGADAHGAIEDPCFVDALHGDWTLQPDLPLLKTGFRPFDWTEAGVDKSDVVWRREAARRTWEDFADAPKAPRYQRRQTLCFDCENAAVGVLRNAMGSLSPLSESPGRPGGLAIVNQDVAQGKKSLKFVEVQGIPHSWEPMVDATCRFEDGQVLMDFSVKAERGAVVTIEARDYDNATPRPFLVGMALCLKDEVFLAEGRPVCKVPNGVWADVRVAFRLDADSSKRWVCQVTPRGGKSAKVVMDRWRDQKFSHLTWIGFMSCGPEGSTWYLDDIRIRKVK